MKAVRVRFLRVLVLLGFLAKAGAADLPQTRYVLEVFDLPAPAAHDLLTQGLKASELHARIRASATLGKLIIGSSKDNCHFEQIEEYQYPTEFDPPQLPQLLAIINPGPTSPQVSKKPAVDPGISPFNAGLGTLTTTTPTAFERRPLGDRLEIEPRPDGNDGRQSITYTLTTSQLASVVHYGDIPAPVFSSKKLSGTVSLTPRQPAFLGTYSPALSSGVPQKQPEPITSLAFLTAFPGASPPVPPADDPFRPSKSSHRSLRITLEAVSMDKAVAQPLFSQESDDTALHNRVVALIAEQKARRETTLVVRGASGQRSVVASADENIEPTEFDPPQIPMTLILANRELLQDIRSGNQTGIGAAPPMPGGNPNGGFGLITTLSPTAFEMNPLGESMEIEAVANGDIIEAQIAASLCGLIGTVPYNGIGHPVYARQKIVTSIRTQLGRPMLLGTLNKALKTGFQGSNQEDRIWLAFLSVTALAK